MTVGAVSVFGPAERPALHHGITVAFPLFWCAFRQRLRHGIAAPLALLWGVAEIRRFKALTAVLVPLLPSFRRESRLDRRLSITVIAPSCRSLLLSPLSLTVLPTMFRRFLLPG